MNYITTLHLQIYFGNNPSNYIFIFYVYELKLVYCIFNIFIGKCKILETKI